VNWAWAMAWMGLPAGALGAAVAARLLWVQAPGMEAWCDLEPAQAACVGRAWVIQAFLHHRLSSTSLGLGVSAWILWWLAPACGAARFPGVLRVAQALALGGVVVAALGLVWYDVDRSAWAVLLSGLCGLRAARSRVASARQGPSGPGGARW
jgi:hypothetical protein